MDLYSFYASSTSYRVRIALHLKGVTFNTKSINLLKLEQQGADYLARNPMGEVPLLDDGGVRVSQSLAIIDYLDRKFPAPRLIPEGGAARNRVLEIAHLIADDVQPLNGLRVLRYLKGDMALDDATRQAWYGQWIAAGFRALEQMLAQDGVQRFCVGDAPTLADCCLVPQVLNAVQHHCAMDAYPHIQAVYAHCFSVPAFQAAAPERQPDFPRKS